MKNTAKEAREAGDKHYFTGKPCKHGHTAPRFTTNRGCTVCVAAEALALRKEKPEIGREQNRRYRERHPEKVHAKNRIASARHYQENRAEYISKSRARKTGYADALRFASNEEKAAVRAIYQESSRLTKETGISHHVDHILPLSLGGEHAAYNLRVVPASENQAKYNTFSAEDRALYTQRVAELFNDA